MANYIEIFLYYQIQRKAYKNGYNCAFFSGILSSMKAVKNLIIIMVGVALLVGIFIYFSGSNAEGTKSERKIISVSSFTLYDVVKHIAGESVDVVNILPLGVDPHSFEPTPKLMAQIEQSDLVLFNGAGLEPWSEGFEFKSRAIDVSKHVNLREVKEEHHDHHEEHHKAPAEHHEHEEHSDEEHHHGDKDPHYWLDFKNMQNIALLVRDELTLLEPSKRSIYEQNAAAYVTMLENLDEMFKQKLSNCKLKTVVINHNALGYLSDNYGFSVESLSGLSSEDQPSPKDIMHIFEEIKEENIATIFFENYVNNRDIRVVAEDANVTLEVFQVLENITQAELDQNLSYEKIMQNNLQKLSKALECN